MSPPADDRGEPPAVWPAGAELADGEAVACACPACARPWRVHKDLAGYRLRCDCGAWVDVPRDRDAPALAAPAAVPLPVARAPSPAPAPRAPAPRAHDGARDRHALERRRIDRTLLELVGLVAAFWVPALVLQVTFVGEERALWMPVADLVACALVVAIGCASPRWAFAGLRGARWRHVVEALGATAAFLAAAAALRAAIEHGLPGTKDLLTELVEALDVPMALLSVALVPALFEELAFRGLLQARIEALYGPLQGVLLSGAAFGLAHGLTLGLPLHLSLGAYLGWLRLRSGSLLPGMLVHLLYNGTLVLLV